MTEESLKAMFTLDEQTSAFTPAGHNLAAQEAVERVAELEGQGKKAHIVDQPLRHRALTFKQCKACTTVAEHLSQSRPGQVREKEDEQSHQS